MSRRRTVLIVLVGCCLLLGGKAIESAAPAVASSTAKSRTAPRDLTKQYPLGPQRLCCQSTSQSHTSAVPPSSGATPAAGSNAGGSEGSTQHTSSAVTVFFWTTVGAAVAGLLAAGVSNLRRAHRESPQALPPGVAAADCPERARAAADPMSRAQHERPAAANRPEVAAQERRHRERPRTVEELEYRRADPLDRSREAFNLGVALHQRGDVTGAMSAYARAERRGDPDASFNLGVLLCEAGELDGAEAWWRRSAHHGNTRATEDLGFLVRRRRERQAAGTDAVPVPAGPVGARAGSAQTRAAPAPAVASGTDSVPRPHNETAARAFRARVIPMDSAIAPMAADAFLRMADDADNATRPENEPRAEDESEDPGDTE